MGLAAPRNSPDYASPDHCLVRNRSRVQPTCRGFGARALQLTELKELRPALLR
jgi:hypothetical protein